MPYNAFKGALDARKKLLSIIYHEMFFVALRALKWLKRLYGLFLPFLSLKAFNISTSPVNILFYLLTGSLLFIIIYYLFFLLTIFLFFYY